MLLLNIILEMYKSAKQDIGYFYFNKLQRITNYNKDKYINLLYYVKYLLFRTGNGEGINFTKSRRGVYNFKLAGIS